MDLNKISVKQQGGQMIPQQPGMQQQQQVDPAIQQISVFFKDSIQQGGKPEEVVMSLIQQEVDQNTIVQALMSLGYQENDLQVLFQNIQQQQQPADPTPQQINQDPQQLARQQEIQQGQEGLNVNVDPIEMAKSGIEIKPENEGKFTAWAKARGMGVQQAASKVMSNKDRYPTSVVKMANFAKNAAKFKKQVGGTVNPSENDKPVFPVDPEGMKEGGEFEPHFMYKGKRKIRAKDMATHLRLKERGYTHEAPKAQTGKEMLDLAKQFAGKNNTTITDQNNNVITGQKNKEAIDNGSVISPLYISPNAFHSGNKWSAAEAVGLVGELFTGIKSAPDNIAADAAANQADKYGNASYNVNVDLSEENTNAVNDYVEQYKIENPNSTSLPDFSDKIKVNENDINSKLNKGVDWLKENLGKLGKSAQGVYNSLKTPDFNPSAQNGGEPLSFKEWVMQDSVRRSTANGQQEYQTYLANFDNFDAAESPSADELYDEINPAELDVDTGGILGGISRLPNTAAAKAFKSGSDWLVRAAGNANDYLEDVENDRKSAKAFLDLSLADNTQATLTDPLFKRGKGPDINTGLYPEIDQVTGYTQLSKYGGGTNNAGFKALPKSVQANILQNMQNGGVPGQQIPGMPTKAQLDAITGADKIQFVPRTPQYDYLASLPEQSVDIQLPNFKEKSAYDKMLVTRLFKNSELTELPSQSENFELDNFQKKMQMGGNPFNPLKVFTEDLEEYQKKGEVNKRKSKVELESQKAELQKQIVAENSRIEGYQSNIDKIYRGLLTSKEVEDEELRQQQLNEILGEDSTIKRSIFDVTVNDYGEKVSGLDTVPKVTRDWLKSGTTAGYGCTSYGCGIMRSAGATTNEGKPFPIISGNSQLNGMIQNNTGGLGMQLMEPGFSDLKPGDRIVSNYSTSGESGDAHTMIFTGDYDAQGSPMMMENSGGRVDGGVNYRSLSSIKGYNDTSDPDSGLRVTRYVGSSNDLNNQLSALQSQLDNGKFFIPPESLSTVEPMGISEFKMPIENTLPKLKMLSKNQYGGERDLFKAQTGLKKGGETVNVDPKMLAKLIAAGADIEML